MYYSFMVQKRYNYCKKLKLTTTKILQKGTTILIKISPLQGEKVYLQIISQKRLVTP